MCLDLVSGTELPFHAALGQINLMLSSRHQYSLPRVQLRLQAEGDDTQWTFSIGPALLAAELTVS